MKVTGVQNNIIHFSKYLLCSTESHAGLKQHKGKWQNFHFLMNYLFKASTAKRWADHIMGLTLKAITGDGLVTPSFSSKAEF